MATVGQNFTIGPVELRIWRANASNFEVELQFHKRASYFSFLAGDLFWSERKTGCFLLRSVPSVFDQRLTSAHFLSKN